MTRTMSEDSYMKYHEARQVNLGKSRSSAEYKTGDKVFIKYKSLFS